VFYPVFAGFTQKCALLLSVHHFLDASHPLLPLTYGQPLSQTPQNTPK